MPDLYSAVVADFAISPDAILGEPEETHAFGPCLGEADRAGSSQAMQRGKTANLEVCTSM